MSTKLTRAQLDFSHYGYEKEDLHLNAAVIQATWRGYTQRRRYRAMLAGHYSIKPGLPAPPLFVQQANANAKAKTAEPKQEKKKKRSKESLPGTAMSPRAGLAMSMRPPKKLKAPKKTKATESRTVRLRAKSSLTDEDSSRSSRDSMSSKKRTKSKRHKARRTQSRRSTLTIEDHPKGIMPAAGEDESFDSTKKKGRKKARREMSKSTRAGSFKKSASMPSVANKTVKPMRKARASIANDNLFEEAMASPKRPRRERAKQRKRRGNRTSSLADPRISPQLRAEPVPSSLRVAKGKKTKLNFEPLTMEDLEDFGVSKSMSIGSSTDITGSKSARRPQTMEITTNTAASAGLMSARVGSSGKIEGGSKSKKNKKHKKKKGSNDVNTGFDASISETESLKKVKGKKEKKNKKGDKAAKHSMNAEMKRDFKLKAESKEKIKSKDKNEKSKQEKKDKKEKQKSIRLKKVSIQTEEHDKEKAEAQAAVLKGFHIDPKELEEAQRIISPPISPRLPPPMAATPEGSVKSVHSNVSAALPMPALEVLPHPLPAGSTPVKTAPPPIHLGVSKSTSSTIISPRAQVPKPLPTAVAHVPTKVIQAPSVIKKPPVIQPVATFKPPVVQPVSAIQKAPPVVNTTQQGKLNTEISRLLTELNMAVYIDSFYDLGVEELEDIELVEDDHWEDIKIKPIHKKKLLMKISQRTQSGQPPSFHLPPTKADMANFMPPPSPLHLAKKRQMDSFIDDSPSHPLPSEIAKKERMASKSAPPKMYKPFTSASKAGLKKRGPLKMGKRGKYAKRGGKKWGANLKGGQRRMLGGKNLKFPLPKVNKS